MLAGITLDVHTLSMYHHSNAKVDATTVGQAFCAVVFTSALTHTHAHNRFTALLGYAGDHPGEQVPER